MSSSPFYDINDKCKNSDRHLIVIHNIPSKHFSDYENDDSIKHCFYRNENNKIALPDRFLPTKEFLDYHYQNIFKK